MSKVDNDDWSATATTWGDGFLLEIETNGNEAAGEVPHWKADRAIDDFLTSNQGFKPGERPRTTPKQASATFAIDGVDMTVTFGADPERVDELADDVFDAVADVLPRAWERVDRTEIVAD